MAQRQAKATKSTEATRGRLAMGIQTPAQRNSTPDASSQNAGNGSMAGDIRTRIEKLAYELYERRGGQDGHDWQDWLEAERLNRSTQEHL